jgi:hypothetical protein
MTDIQSLRLKYAAANNLVIGLENTDTLGDAGLAQLAAAQRERADLARQIAAHDESNLIASLRRIERKANIMAMDYTAPDVQADVAEIQKLVAIALRSVGEAK